MDRYTDMTLKHYFEVNNKDIMYCPTPNCPHAFIKTDDVKDIENIRCPACDKEYCLKCKMPPHRG